MNIYYLCSLWGTWMSLSHRHNWVKRGVFLNCQHWRGWSGENSGKGKHLDARERNQSPENSILKWFGGSEGSYSYQYHAPAGNHDFFLYMIISHLIESQSGSSLVASLLRIRMAQDGAGSTPWPRNFCMSQVQAGKKKKKLICLLPLPLALALALPFLAL